ncbi:LOW QUALITY PROTEIN: hypothetical protein PHMEG_00032431 [Phytophthora megakarya]|uniref:Uncharacterized protein n=1 Tax=Phytophthora megakarya TaxID=4795 RepID=A0A225UVL3_9STRA|nr:LOW QUALITY PROTEIN: hypothetical protein PHMEG_00032431 [Phytophthora megakarya]
MVSIKLLTAFVFIPLGHSLSLCRKCAFSRIWQESMRSLRASYQSNSDRPLLAFGFIAEEASDLFQSIQWLRVVKKWIEGIAIKISCKLETNLETLFGLMFDGWAHGGTHYVVRYAVYGDDKKLRVPTV